MSDKIAHINLPADNVKVIVEKNDSINFKKFISVKLIFAFYISILSSVFLLLGKINPSNWENIIQILIAGIVIGNVGTKGVQAYQRKGK